MANWSLSLNAGETEFSIVEGSDAPTTGDIEITVNVAKLRATPGAQSRQTPQCFRR